METQKKINWPQLASLAGLYSSVIIGWIAYYNYQPKLLENFGFVHFTFMLFVAQGLILVITPPIAGKIGDRFRKNSGHRLPVITAGISFAAMVFMAVAFTLMANPGEILKWLLPFLIILWLFSMSIFTSPAISTIELFAPAEKLPSAMAIITLVSGLIYAVEPIIVELIDYLGAPTTFICGGVAVLVSGYFLRKTSQKVDDKIEIIVDQEEEVVVEPERKMDFSFVIALGVAFGIASTVLFNKFPDRLEDIFVTGPDSFNGNQMVSMVLAFSAFISIPIGRLVEKYGASLSAQIGIVGLFIAMFGVLLINSGTGVIICTLLFSILYTLVSVSTLPLALSKVDFKRKVFGVGLFFAGFEIPNGILEAFMKY
ncbi:MAG: MFS transporter [Cyclobacteriaceae bacterium]